MINQIISFLLGIMASLVAAYLYARYSSKIIQDRAKSLEGYWLETVETSGDRIYSIAQFAFDPKTNSYSFDGSNFTNDGNVFCTWSSISVRIDQTARRIFYIFRSCVKGDSHTENHGFGVINFSVNDSGEPLPEAGYYIEAKRDGVPHAHTMERLTDVCSRLGIATTPGETIEAFHCRIVGTLQARRTQSPSDALHNASKAQSDRGWFHVDQGQYLEAIECFDLASAIAITNHSAVIGKAYALKRLDRVNEAYDLMDQLVQRAPAEAGGFYNRACYGNLLKRSALDILNDLRMAITLHAACKAMAASDTDFYNLRSNPEFCALVELRESCWGST